MHECAKITHLHCSNYALRLRDTESNEKSVTPREGTERRIWLPARAAEEHANWYAFDWIDWIVTDIDYHFFFSKKDETEEEKAGKDKLKHLQ